MLLNDLPRAPIDQMPGKVGKFVAPDLHAGEGPRGPHVLLIARLPLAGGHLVGADAGDVEHAHPALRAHLQCAPGREEQLSHPSVNLPVLAWCSIKYRATIVSSCSASGAL